MELSRLIVSVLVLAALFALLKFVLRRTGQSQLAELF